MKKRNNLKCLFIFNGLLLIVAFAFIQYSVVRHDNAPVLVETNISSDDMSYNPVVKDILKERFVLYNALEPMPDFPFKTSFERDVTFDDLKGQWVIVNMWATWCPPCLAEMPYLQEFQDKYKGQGVKVVAISLDRNMDGKKLNEFNNKRGFGPIASYYGDGKLAMELFAMRGLPTTYILEPGGRAIGSISGDIDWSADYTSTFMDSLLKR